MNGVLNIIQSKGLGVVAIDFRASDQHKGVGSALMRSAAQLAQGDSDNTLSIHGAVPSAKPFYQKMGAEFTVDNRYHDFGSTGTLDEKATKALADGKCII